MNEINEKVLGLRRRNLLSAFLMSPSKSVKTDLRPALAGASAGVHTPHAHSSPVGLDSVVNVYVDVVGNELLFFFSFVADILYKPQHTSRHVTSQPAPPARRWLHPLLPPSPRSPDP